MGGSKTTRWAIAAALLVILIAGAASLYANRHVLFKADAPAATGARDLARFAVGPLSALETSADPVQAPEYVFHARDGSEVRFDDFRGRVTVVNLWAMWCAPCRTEMPTLARLAEAYAGTDLVVVPVNVDTGEAAVAEATAFIDAHPPLPLYNDAKFQLPFLFPGKGKMPQTILLDRQGRVRAALAGEADWAGPEARALVDALLEEGPAA